VRVGRGEHLGLAPRAGQFRARLAELRARLFELRRESRDVRAQLVVALPERHESDGERGDGERRGEIAEEHCGPRGAAGGSHLASLRVEREDVRGSRPRVCRPRVCRSLRSCRL
jgi:hypothetical protein